MLRLRVCRGSGVGRSPRYMFDSATRTLPAFIGEVYRGINIKVNPSSGGLVCAQPSPGQTWPAGLPPARSASRPPASQPAVRSSATPTDAAADHRHTHRPAPSPTYRPSHSPKSPPAGARAHRASDPPSPSLQHSGTTVQAHRDERPRCTYCKVFRQTPNTCVAPVAPSTSGREACSAAARRR